MIRLLAPRFAKKCSSLYVFLFLIIGHCTTFMLTVQMKDNSIYFRITCLLLNYRIYPRLERIFFLDVDLKTKVRLIHGYFFYKNYTFIVISKIYYKNFKTIVFINVNNNGNIGDDGT